MPALRGSVVGEVVGEPVDEHGIALRRVVVESVLAVGPDPQLAEVSGGLGERCLDGGVTHQRVCHTVHDGDGA